VPKNKKVKSEELSVIPEGNPPMIELEGGTINYDEYYFNAVGFKSGYISTYGPEVFSTYPDLSEKVLLEIDEMLIQNKAIAKWAKEVGYDLDDMSLSELEVSFEAVKSQFESDEAFYDYLSRNGVNEEKYKSIMRENMLVTKFIEYLSVSGNVEATTVSEEEIDKKIVDDDLLSAKHILISRETGSEDDRAVAEEILEKIKAGEDFDELMYENTDDPGIERFPNGYVFAPGEFVTEFEETTRLLEIGEVSDIVVSDYGFFIIKRIEMDRNQVRDRIIMEKLIAEISSRVEKLNANPTQLRLEFNMDSVILNISDEKVIV
jgi:parvulin-like peptidyl-prolyl isomerase